MIDDDFVFLQDWYARHCDGDWEHDERIQIRTIDNPGWRLSINVEDTELSGRSMLAIRTEVDANDWIHCWHEQDVFNAACGPGNLPQALSAFRTFAESASEPR